MADNAAYFRRQAAEQSEIAAAEGLTNVRDVHLRAAAKWTAMAVRADRFERTKQDRVDAVDAARDVIVPAVTLA